MRQRGCIGIISVDEPTCTYRYLQGKLDFWLADVTRKKRLSVRGLRGDFGQEFFDFDVGEDDIGIPLKGFVVASFETVPFLRRTDEGSSFDQKVFHFNRR